MKFGICSVDYDLKEQYPSVFDEFKVECGVTQGGNPAYIITLKTIQDIVKLTGIVGEIIIEDKYITVYDGFIE